MQIPGISSFLQELESHCGSIAIVTFLDSEGEPLILDLKRQGQRVTYGAEWDIKELFVSKLLIGCQPYGSLILRSFTAEIDECTQLPIKELRGYILKSDGDDLEFEKLPPHAMFACHNTDAETGEPLPLEQSIRYC
ncbi:MAG TPA: hypothetical protein DDZ80_12200 [Cyanobacteria bacterium UBA8803]|nr:hypothetical protein [Cyanobacteria bacterium UBA9273]HBL59241.1 hypothetical protein [Cyanobacteria bacterium UBA8803]